MEYIQDSDIHIFYNKSISLTNPVLFLPLCPSSGHVYTTNQNTILAEDAENIIYNLYDYAECESEPTSFCFAQSGVVWGGTGISQFIQQLHTDHSNYAQSPHHRGAVTWIAVAGRDDIQYVAFSGLAKSHDSFLNDATASVVSHNRLDLDIDVESPRISFQSNRSRYEKFEDRVPSLVKTSNSGRLIRISDYLQKEEDWRRVSCTNPYWNQPTRLAQDLVGFRDINEKHTFVDIISSMEDLQGYIPSEEDPIYKMFSLNTCVLPGTSQGKTYNIYVSLSALSR